MPSDTVKSALYDIRDNIRFVQEFVAGFTYKQFAASRLHFYAVTGALEIISEASRRLPDDIARPAFSVALAIDPRRRQYLPTSI